MDRRREVGVEDRMRDGRDKRRVCPERGLDLRREPAGGPPGQELAAGRVAAAHPHPEPVGVGHLPHAVGPEVPERELGVHGPPDGAEVPEQPLERAVDLGVRREPRLASGDPAQCPEDEQRLVRGALPRAAPHPKRGEARQHVGHPSVAVRQAGHALGRAQSSAVSAYVSSTESERWARCGSFASVRIPS